MPRVTGYTRTIPITLAIDTNAYTAGDQFGGRLELLDALRHEASRSVLQTLTVIDVSGTAPRLDFLFFQGCAELASSNNDPFSMTDDEAKTQIIGCVEGDGAWKDYGGICVSTVNNIGLVLQGQDKNMRSTSIFAVPVIRTASTFGAADNVVVKFGLFQD
jgi:hypothetical protein